MLIGVRWAAGMSHVEPISSASGFGPALSHLHRSMFMNRVEPTTSPSAARVVAKGKAVPSSWSARALAT